MGEAWFMGAEREMFTDALVHDFDALPPDYVEKMLEEIATGRTCFGEMDEWTEWFHYLLPRVLSRQPLQLDPLDYPYELLMTALFAEHPDKLNPEPYRGFEADVLATAGTAIMSPDAWDGARLRIGTGLVVKSRKYGKEWWYLDEANPALSASMFVPLKYLPPSGIHSWVTSIAAIECPFWRAQIMVWLLGAKRFLVEEVEQPRDFEKLSPRIEWKSSHSLSGFYDGTTPHKALLDERGKPMEPHGPRPLPFVQPINLAAFREAVSKELPGAVRKDWIEQVCREPILVREMGSLVGDFENYSLSD